MSAGTGAEAGVARLGWRDHLEGLRHALLAFTRNAERAGLRAVVPTTPDWNVRRLIAHQGMVHRWAAAQLRGERVLTAALEQEGIDAVDPLDWLRDGAVEVATAIARAPTPRTGGRPSRPMRARRGSSGLAGSATRRPSMRSTRSRPSSAVSRRRPTPGSTR